MTELQSLMLSFCFGACLGLCIAEIIICIKLSVDERKAKKERESQDK